jgi:hypothetical protein
MRCFDARWTLENIVAYLRTKARSRIFNGLDTLANQVHLRDCTAGHLQSGTLLVLTYEDGYHSSGWWKNPDYERCVHLSLSFRDPVTGKPRSRDKEWSDKWIEVVFGPTKNLIWVEGPAGPEGKRADVWHYRVFYAEDWVAPILPRGEVYSKDWTPAGWLSFSDMQEKLARDAFREEERQRRYHSKP